ncbi:hypothetical protein [Roseateles violae]|uniref:Uncharacterized protein n=1 Tax=Roseateles violae TaxID=3058042 RepID=A0ABT8DL66_9BURK|nr:hypothetical protein [Pelomonas sp. PFR6]MDN3918847.1 hypothetical protein [Pelomonas sp. PFR6]
MAAAILLMTLGGFAAVAVHAAYPLLIGAALAVGYYFLRQHRAPLMPITPDETRTAKRSAWAAFLTLLIPWGSS